MGESGSCSDWTGPCLVKDLPCSSDSKESAAMRETWVQSLGQEDPLEKGMAIHSSILAWRIPCAEEPGGPQSTQMLSNSIIQFSVDGRS